MRTTEETDFRELDDSALIGRRRAMRAALEKLPPHSDAHRRLAAWYDISTIEIDQRARRAWTGTREQGEPVDRTDRVILLAVDILLTAPEALGNDALETDLYLLRERLTGQESD